MKCALNVLTCLLAVLPPTTGWTASIDEPKTTTQSPPQPTPARTLTHIELKQSGGDVSVHISGDGRLSYRVRPLDADRVIVDLVNVSTTLGHAFEFNNPIVKQIRIGQHPHVLRLVIDLRKPAVYSIQEGQSTVSITLAPRIAMGKPIEASAPVLPRRSLESLGTSAEGETAGAMTQLPAHEPAEHQMVSTLESTRTSSDPRPRQDVRNRAADRRMIDQPTTQPATERYVAVFGGASLSQSFTNVHGVGANASVKVSDLALARTGIGGLKLGFSPSTARWLALETEVFYASPHFKAQSVTVTGGSGTLSSDFSGSYTRVATLAFNWIVRYPGEWVQPYAGVGLGIFWGRLADSGGTSSSDTSPGLNALAGIRVKLGQHLLLFSEYKYNRTSFDFSNADFHVLYQAHYVVGGLGWSF